MSEQRSMPRRMDAPDRLRRLAVSTSAGAVAGLAIGGVGGRLAMLLLRLTSDPKLHGLPTDDDFTIGVVSSQSGFLLMLTFVIGAFGGSVYFFARPVLPGRWAPWIWGALGATIGGAAILRPGGIDFTLLEPVALAVALFIAIPALGAAATSLLAERWIPRARSAGWFLGLVPFAGLAVAGPTTAIVFAIMLALTLGLPASWFVSRDAVPSAVAIGGRAVVAIAGALGAYALVGDVLEL